MSEIALANINTLPSERQVDSVQPSEQLITLTSGQLQELIKGAIEQAIQPLLDEIAALREEIDQDRQEIAALRLKMASLENLHEQDTNRICLDIAYDRQRIAKLEHPPIKKPGKTVISRAEKIERYLASRPDHRATFETLKGYLGIDNDLLGIAIKSLPYEKYTVIKTPGDKRKRTLLMIPR